MTTSPDPTTLTADPSAAPPSPAADVAAATSPASVPPASLSSSLRLAAADIKLAHSVFALPFAIIGAFLATPATRRDDALAGLRAFDAPWRHFAVQLAVVVLCMVCARTWAMLINRIADREFDARNARTARRALASGRLSLGRARVFAALAALAFIAAAGLFYVLDKNLWPISLSVPVLAWIALYSYTKRFTALCHLFLGGALGVSPLAAALAVNPDALLGTPALFWIAGFVVLWVAGFDVLYAIQDIDFDRGAALNSIPAKVGLEGALWAARGLHAIALVMLLAAWTSEPRLEAPFGVGVALVGVLLTFEHVIVARRGLAGIPLAFFTLNGIVSCALGAAAIADFLLA